MKLTPINPKNPLTPSCPISPGFTSIMQLIVNHSRKRLKHSITEKHKVLTPPYLQRRLGGGCLELSSRREGVIHVLIVLITLLAGCASKPVGSVPASLPSRTNYVIHLPGISGRMYHDRMFAAGLVDAGMVNQVDIDNWPGKSAGVSALQNQQLHKDESARIARKILDIHQNDPSARIYLTAHSGGTGIAVWALEDLPDNIHVESVILLASALTPGYDLSKALKHVDNTMISIYSPYDQYVLGAGTRLLGTIDGPRDDAAGLIGFEMPPGADALQYKKFKQIKYTTEMEQLGNDGSHIGPMTRLFARVFVSKILTSDR